MVRVYCRPGPPGPPDPPGTHTLDGIFPDHCIARHCLTRSPVQSPTPFGNLQVLQNWRFDFWRWFNMKTINQIVDNAKVLNNDNQDNNLCSADSDTFSAFAWKTWFLFLELNRLSWSLQRVRFMNNWLVYYKLLGDSWSQSIQSKSGNVCGFCPLANPTFSMYVWEA